MLSDEEVIFANISATNHKKLKEKYPGVNIDDLLEKKIKYYRLKPFKGRSKAIWVEKIKDWIEFINEDFIEEPRKETNEPIHLDIDLQKIIVNYYGKRDLAKQLLEIQPLYYDKAKLWWAWDKKNFKWMIIDETDILNIVDELVMINTVQAKERIEILEALRQAARKQEPKPMKPTWIQFKDLIIDIATGKEIKASNEFFVTNPIPYPLHKERYVNTPIMNKIFEEWVGEDYVQTLYEIISYCMIPSYPLHRIFCFIGAGMNGKSCFLTLLRKFLGKENICSTELDTLLTSRFEVTRLHKKLVCQMGETNFSEMNKTSMLKKLSGGDLIGFEYKNKDPFQDINYAKIIIATNNLPTSSDKTVGFYRRWMIIDFPNEFSERKDILEDIPEEEYESLAVKCLSILCDLLKEKRFHREGSIADRMKKYEDRSDPLEKFIKEYTVEDVQGFIWKFEFERRLTEWCKENRFRIMSEVAIGRKMKEKGIVQEHKQATWMVEGVQKRYRAWEGIVWKDESAQDAQDAQVTSTQLLGGSSK